MRFINDERNRIAGEIEELRNKRSGITKAEMIRQETLGRVREIGKVLRGGMVFRNLMRSYLECWLNE